jgi:GNAT superfamily N-acetyltransferase
MYFNRTKYLYSTLFETLRLSKDKSVWSVVLGLGGLLKLMIFKKVEMFVIAFDLSNKIHVPNLKNGLRINPIVTQEQIARLNKIVGLHNYKPDCIKSLKKIISNGSYGFFAFQNGKPIGTCWASEETPASLFPVQVPSKPGDICVHTLFVSPLARGKKIGEALASYRLWFLQKQDYKRAVAIVNKDNRPALNVNTKIGYVPIGEVSGFRFLFWSRLRYTWY